jgi:predicted DNA-binding protein (UPF0251 family)
MVGTTNGHAGRDKKTPLQAKLVQRVLAMLSPEERFALVLRHTRRLGYAEIAHKLGCPRAVAIAVLAQAESKVRAAQRALIEAIIEVKSAPPASSPRAKQQPKVRAVNDPVAVQIARA